MAAPSAVADGKLYCVNEEGEVVVPSANPEKFEVLSWTSLGGEPTCSSIALVDASLSVRTAESLYCIGK